MHEEMVVQHADCFQSGFEGLINILFVVRFAANKRAESAAEGGEDLMVGEGHPADDRGVVLFRFPQEASLFILRCYFVVLANVVLRNLEPTRMDEAIRV